MVFEFLKKKETPPPVPVRQESPINRNKDAGEIRRQFGLECKELAEKAVDKAVFYLAKEKMNQAAFDALDRADDSISRYHKSGESNLPDQIITDKEVNDFAEKEGIKNNIWGDRVLSEILRTVIEGGEKDLEKLKQVVFNYIKQKKLREEKEKEKATSGGVKMV